MVQLNYSSLPPTCYIINRRTWESSGDWETMVRNAVPMVSKGKEAGRVVTW